MFVLILNTDRYNFDTNKLKICSYKEKLNMNENWIADIKITLNAI